MPLNKTKIFARADKFIAKQNYQKALTELLKVLKELPRDASLLNKIGDLYSKIGDSKQAIAYFMKVAESYETGGFNQKAVALYKKMIRLEPSHTEAQERLVELYLQKEHHREAKSALLNLANLYLLENLGPRALNCYDRILALDPQDTSVRCKVSEILVKEGRENEAIEQFLDLAKVFLEQKKWEEATRLLNQAKEITPDAIPIKLLEAKLITASTNHWEPAISLLTNILKEKPNTPEAQKVLGDTYLKLGRLSEAKEQFIKLLENSPQHTEPLETLATTYLEKGNLDQACQLLTPVSEALVEREEYEKAIALYRKIQYINEEHLPTLEGLLNVYQASFQESHVILVLEQLISLCLKQNQLAKAEERIKQLLEIEPDRDEWLAKLNALKTSPRQDPTSSQSISAQALSDEETDSPILADGNLEETADISSSGSGAPPTRSPRATKENMNLEPNDPKSVLINHLTEAEVFLKYGLHDKALPHLLAVKEQDFLNEDANLKLKHLYLERTEIDKAVGCMVCLVNACIEKEDYDQASEYVQEIETFHPNIAQIHKSRLASLRQESVSQLDETSSVSKPNPIIAPSAHPTPLGTEFLSEQNASGPVFESKNESGKAEWTLDSPNNGPAQKPGQAQSIQDLYRDAAKEKEATPDRQSPALDSQDHVAPKTQEQAPTRKKLPPELASELNEIKFFMSLEAFQDAFNLLLEAKKRFGNHEELLKQEAIIEARLQQEVSVSKPQTKEKIETDLLSSPSAPGFFDLAEELSAGLDDGPFEEVSDKGTEEEIQSSEELLNEFKKGVEEQIDASDYATHYELGIAYKEMGLLDEAIRELELVRASKAYFIECATLMGQCLADLGREQEASQHYETALATPGITENERVALLYEFALFQQSTDHLDRARALFLKIQEAVPNYRDVNNRLKNDPFC